jgi:hypothetical protein
MSLVQSMNELSNTGTSREFFGLSLIPAGILASLLIFTLASAGLVGLLVGESPSHRRPTSGLLVVLYSITFMLILDLDRPLSGRIKGSQLPMQNVASRLDADARTVMQAHAAPELGAPQDLAPSVAPKVV